MKPLKSFLNKETLAQLYRYLVTGFTAFGIEYALYVFLLKVLGWHYVLSSVIVYALVFWFSFIINRIWSFKSKGDMRKQVIQYGLLFFFNLVVANVILMTFFIDIVGISPLVSPFLKMACVVCWNFLIYKTIIYKE
ncbi:MAG TPA: GtrA family protein [Clostridiales bacterium UBA8960]|jgi:putative flippase GtrA|nr:GtrA family protein [Clostridiales bacterium UBA8960]